ncbi:MAG: alpha-galactosidase [Oscillospiraceae bacterium]|nr:alpha-galactosidase [Oscillospiraceae bacterium]
MAITFNAEKKLFSLETRNTTYQLRIDQFGIVQHIYYGGKIYGDSDYIVRYACRGFGATISDAGTWRDYELDTISREYPTIGLGDFRAMGLILQNADGSRCVDPRYVSHSISNGKYALEGLPAIFASEKNAQTLSVITEDPVSHVQVELLYGVLPDIDIITRSVRIKNGGTEQVTLEKVASACLDLSYGAYDLLSFCGTNCRERQLQRTPIGHGRQSIGSRRGSSSHQYNPAVIVAEKGATESAGGCYGMMFVYSGNFLLEAEKTQFEQTRVIMGIQPECFQYPLAPGQVFTVPETVMTYSEHGFAMLSQRYHYAIMHHLCRGKYVNADRPVLLNSWEAAYFDFTGETIYQLAVEAAELGVELVVMDDGWFGQRNDDNSGLGDWNVNEEKLGCTLGQLIEKINALGVKFGIWFEPEMISENSDLYRAHPDWALKIPSRNPVRSRNQLLLDFSRKEVRDHIFEMMCKVLDQGNVEYVKWDMNRSMEDVWSTERCAGAVAHEYILGVYDLMERLITRYPNILLESCSGGGGRFDAGMLYYSPQIWCSDNTDALDRIKIQHGTSFFYPVPSMGSHVSVCPNHQTWRNIKFNTRGIVAMSGTFGYELNPATLPPEIKAKIKDQIIQYKECSKLIREGRYYRLTNPHESELAAWEFVSPNQKEVLLNMVIQEVHGSRDLFYVKLRGLQQQGIYKDVVTGMTYNGAALMKVGYPVPEMKGNVPAFQVRFKLSEE